MTKYFILVGILILAGLAIIFFWAGVPTIHQEQITDNRQISLYNNNGQLIDRIHITVFYFVPRDKQDLISEKWKTPIQKSLAQLKAFHSQQTQGLSQLSFFIQPEPIIGNKNSLDYDTLNTNAGNPEGLRNTAFELIERGLLPENDNDQTDNEYQSVLIVYEGVGAGSSEHVAFLNNAYLTQDQYINSYGNAFLAHEFYHTLGVPDTYEAPDDIPLSNDLMGLGRYRPLDLTYLDSQVIQSLGL